jgi:hypothetical protein
MEEVRRIVIIRGMRVTLSYQVGFAFFAMIANFRSRRVPIPLRLGEDDYAVPKFDTKQAEETAIRKEIRELFAESIKGLDFEDLIKDRETFDKLYATSVPPMRCTPDVSLAKLEVFLDEILNCEEMCEILHVEYSPGPTMPRSRRATQEMINVEEKRRNSVRRQSVEVLSNNTTTTSRRLSVEQQQRRGSSTLHESLGGANSGVNLLQTLEEEEENVSGMMRRSSSSLGAADVTAMTPPPPRRLSRRFSHVDELEEKINIQGKKVESNFVVVLGVALFSVFLFLYWLLSSWKLALFLLLGMILAWVIFQHQQQSKLL